MNGNWCVHKSDVQNKWNDNLHTRALSLGNLVSGYECGRVFPAGVGPGSPSGNEANWLSSRLSRSAETRRWYGWLRMEFSGARLFRAPIWCTSGGGGTREAGGTVAESLVALYRVNMHQTWRRWRAAHKTGLAGARCRSPHRLEARRQ